MQAIQKDSNFAKNVGQLVVLGGSFNASGNVNPAAEANVSLKRQKSHSRNVRESNFFLHIGDLFAYLCKVLSFISISWSKLISSSEWRDIFICIHGGCT